MKKMVTILMAVLLTAGAATAADWEKTADLGLIFTQSGYSDSWAGDELGTVVWTFTGDLLAQKDITATTNWRNTLKLTYGQTHQEHDDGGEKTWGSPIKSTDRIFLESLMRFGIENPLTPYVAFAAETQFHDANDNIFSPALLTESAGVGRELIKNDRTELLTRVGLGVRQRMAYGMKTVDDAGFEWVSDLSHTFNDRLKAVSKLRVFQAVTSSLKDDLAGLPNQDDWKGTDVAFETTFSASVSKYIQTTLFVEWLYDKEISRKGRYREIFGFGITYKLF